MSSFWRTYEELWNPDPSGSPSTPLDIARITLVLAIGTTFSASNDTERDKLRDLTQTWIHSAQSWLFGPGEKTSNTIKGLQTLCLLFLARHTTYNCPGATASFSASSLLTMAMTMGLHRNPDIFQRFSPMQKQMRVRLWTTILEFAVQSSLERSLPLGVTPEGHDVPLPLNVNDADLEAAGTNGTLDERDDFTDSTLQILLAKTLSLRMGVVELLAGLRSNQDYNTVLELGSHLRAANRDMASCFRPGAILTQETTSKSIFVAGEFHRKLLDITLRRTTLLLHRASMLQARSDPRFYFSRKSCAESSMVILSHSGDADMSLPSGELDDFLRMALVGRGVFKGAFGFDAILALTFEIFTQLGSETIYSEVDPLDDMARAERAPFIGTLRRISQQQSQMVGRASVSFKSHIVLIACLCQIDAMESDRPAQPKLVETIAAEVKRCYQILRQKDPSLVPIETSSNEAEETQMSDFLSLDLNLVRSILVEPGDVC